MSEFTERGEPIVRCRDCVFYDTVHLDCARQGWADCEPMGFCSWGMAKEDAPKGPRMPRRGSDGV